MRQGEVLSPIESFGFSALLDASMTSDHETSATCCAVGRAEFCSKFADAFIGVGMDSCCMLGKHISSIACILCVGKPLAPRHRAATHSDRMSCAVPTAGTQTFPPFTTSVMGAAFLQKEHRGAEI